MRRIPIRNISLVAVSFVLFISTAHSAEVSGKLFVQAREAFAKEEYAQTATLCWKYLAKNTTSADKYESAQFFLAQSLEKLGLYHGAVEYYFQVASNRRTPELLPRAIRGLERLALERPIDEGLILRDLIGDTDFGTLPDDLGDFVHYWQGLNNLQRGLDGWARERFLKIDRKGYYFFAAIFAATTRLLKPSDEATMTIAAQTVAQLLGPLDLGAALESLRRRGESDSKLAYTLKALLNDDNQIEVNYRRLPEGWEIELALLAYARIAAEAEAVLLRTKETDEEALGKPFSYQVQIGGIPIYRRAPNFEERAPAIQAARAKAIPMRKIHGLALHSLARLLYEQKRYAAAYDTLSLIPPNTELSSEILLERAWAKYKSGDPHRAMGLLYAMDAPVYRSLFAPEKYVLKGLIYREFCHYRAAKVAARQFRIAYEDTIRAIRNGDDPKTIKSVRKAALRRGESRKLFLFSRALRDERDAIADLDDEWEQSGLKKQLQSLYETKINQTKSDVEQSLDGSAKEVAEEMLDTEEQVNLLEYEVGQAIFQRVGEDEGSAVSRTRAPKVPLSSERVYYRFTGEYWTEELPLYKFNIDDRCVD